jgi:hypothetical protein
VLWGWLGEELRSDEVAAVRRVGAEVRGRLGELLADHLGDVEIEALARRCERLAAKGVMPAPRGEWPAIPWPPF